MNNIYKSIDELIGNTPLLELNNIKKETNGYADILGKLEMFNPAGSAKDRIALAMINDAEERGLISAGATLIEPTSGNTGIGLAAVGVHRGYKVIVVMPDNMSLERQKLMRAYGAELVLTEGTRGMAGALERAEQLAAEKAALHKAQTAKAEPMEKLAAFTDLTVGDYVVHEAHGIGQYMGIENLTVENKRAH